MDDVDSVNMHLEKLREFVKRLKPYVGVTAEELRTDGIKQAVVERNLELAAQSCIDVAEHLISDQRLKIPADSHEAIVRLGEAGIIDGDFANGFAGVAGFRNILAHEYMDIDYEKVADNLNNRLDDFERFAKEVARFLI